MDDDPPGGVEPVEPTAVVEEGPSLRVPQAFVLDRRPHLRVGEVHACDEAALVVDAVLGHWRHAGPLQEQPRPGLLG